MIQRLLGLCLGLTLIFASGARAEHENTGLYVGGLMGSSFFNDTRLSSPTLGNDDADFKPGFTFGALLGYDFGQGLRLEGEVSYRENILKSGGGKDPQVGISGMMFNVYYDFFPFKNQFEVYAGGGLGPATAQLETISLGRSINEDETVLAYQLETGIGYNVTPLATFTLGYRYFDAGDPDFQLNDGSRVTMSLSSHEILLKMRYRFPL